MPVVHTCSVTGCYGSSMINPGLTFFRFPTGDKLRYLKWVDFSQNPLLMAHREKFIYAHICASHFDESQFRTPLQDKLVHKAVPSIPALGLHPLPGSQTNPIPSPLQATSVQDPSLPSVSATCLPKFPSFSKDYVPLSPLRERAKTGSALGTARVAGLMDEIFVMNVRKCVVKGLATLGYTHQCEGQWVWTKLVS
uniref:THAP-type domain-containing protein n=1 Tax=Timema monikensis TaxID=170555 RepID=A0A7R9HVA8_9NEOP|nr:unnamed protein product [Timema monikensis]